MLDTHQRGCREDGDERGGEGRERDLGGREEEVEKGEKEKVEK